MSMSHGLLQHAGFRRSCSRSWSVLASESQHTGRGGGPTTVAGAPNPVTTASIGGQKCTQTALF